jgi:hypothetical protein
MCNNEKLNVFHTIASRFNEVLESCPILYGSLGLSLSINIEIETDDIDILVEQNIFTLRLDDIDQIMMELGFKLIERRENIFIRNDLKIGMASDGDLMSFSNVDPSSLARVNASATYRVLSALDYLSTYKASSKDGYRKNTRLKNDEGKIKLIESVIFA